MARLVPDRPLPPYAFVPGLAPHPNHPGGHSHGLTAAIPDPLDPERWCQCETYLYGIDLFNGPAPPMAGPDGLDSGRRGSLPGFYWESHVEFESLWIACGRKGLLADFLKGLIQLAAAGVKHHEGRPAGVASHAGRAAELWRENVLSGREALCGLSLTRLIDLAESILERGWPDPAPVLVLSPAGG